MDDLATRQVRSFNRSVTQRIGALHDEYLARGRPLGASRVLWEIGDDGTDLRVLRDRLDLDSGYLSRLVASLERARLVVVVGFTGGSIPEVKVNRLLLNNIEVVGAGWGASAMSKPDFNREVGAEVNRLADEGFVRPIVGERFALEHAADALKAIDERRAVGKVVLELAR